MSLDVLQVRDKRVPVLNITHQLSSVKHATKLDGFVASLSFWILLIDVRYDMLCFVCIEI